ncbi:hypothetical protein KKC17_01285 [Patescibacteria group bacterium]|nr:hypothetical protein [Patescibacteria group bacterium]
MDSQKERVILTPGFHVLEPLLTTDEFGRQIVVKTIGQADKDILNKEMAEQLVKDIKYYHSILKNNGVAVPEQISVEMINHDNGRWGIVEKSLFSGIDLEKLLLKGTENDCVRLVKGILMNLNKIFLLRNLDSYDIEVTVDPKPANWVCDFSGVVYYVDLIPPRFRNGRGEILLEFPRATPLAEDDWKFLYRRYFDRRGIIHILFVQLCRLRPELRPIFSNLIIDFLTDLEDVLVLEFFNSLPAQRLAVIIESGISPGEAINEIIDTIGLESADNIRDIALQLLQKKSTFLAEIFNLSHVDMSGRLHSENVEKLKKLLVKLANGNH